MNVPIPVFLLSCAMAFTAGDVPVYFEKDPWCQNTLFVNARDESGTTIFRYFPGFQEILTDENYVTNYTLPLYFVGFFYITTSSTPPGNWLTDTSKHFTFNFRQNASYVHYIEAPVGEDFGGSIIPQQSGQGEDNCATVTVPCAMTQHITITGWCASLNILAYNITVTCA